MMALQTLTQSILTVVDEFFPAITIRAPIIANMASTATMPPVIFVRMYWIKTHPGQKLTNSEYDQLELIDIYLRFPDLDWKTDKYITIKLDEKGMNGP